MDDQDPTSVINMIKDLRSGTDSYRKSIGASLRFSGAGYIRTKFSESDDSVISPKRQKLDESDTSIINQTQSDSAPGSPWEWRRMKGEIISLKTRLTHQEATVQQLHNVRRQMEEIFEKEKGLLQVQVEQDAQTIQQLEVRLDVARRTIQDAREAQATAEKEWFQVRNNLEKKIASLLTENAKLSENLRNASTKESSSPLQDTSESNELQLKLETMEAKATMLEGRMKEYLKVQQDYELQNVELQNMKIKLEKLESERALWEEGKMLVGRAARANDLEKELNVAKKTIAVLKESVREKLLLEEQMANMTKRLEHTEKVEQQVAVLEAKRSELALRLQEYETIGIIGGPTAVKRELNRLQQAEVDLRAEEGQLRSRLDAVLRESQNLSKNYEDAKKLATDVTSSKEKLNKLVSRLQKKMILVTRERDSYRQQLDLYEKEMTVDGNNAMTERIPALERAIDGYRDLVNKLEADLQAAETGTQKNECNKLREEIEQLKGELEHRALKGDFNCNARILHFTMNPSAIAEKQAEEKQAALLREVEELRAKVGSGNYGATTSSLQIQGTTLKILRLDVPSIADPRSEKVSLKCEYDLGGKELYSVTWVKDDHEIFRYMPRAENPKRAQNITDLYIDLSRSDSKQVTLLGSNSHKGEINLAGTYGCEVSSEGPSFETVYKEANMSVAIPPKDRPTLDGMRASYKIGDILEAECTSASSYPPAVLTFILNGKEVNRALTKDLQTSNMDENIVSTTRLGLTLRLERHHFSDGKLTVVCQSALPGIANNLVSESREIATLAASNQRLAQEPPKSGVSRSNAEMFYMILIFWIVTPIHIIRYNSLRFLRV